MLQQNYALDKREADPSHSLAVRAMKRGCIYFVLALVLEWLLLLSGKHALIVIFLFPGLILSFLISHSSNTSSASFIIGLVADAALYAYVACWIETAIRHRSLPR